MKRMFYNLGFVLKYYWKENKIYVISFFLKIAFGAIIIAVDSTLLLKIVFDCFDNSKPFNQTMLYVAVIAGINVINIIGSPMFDKIFKDKIDMKVKGVLQTDLFDRIGQMDMLFYDNPEFYDEYSLVYRESGTRPQLIMQHLGDILYNIVNLITVFIIILRIDYVVVLIIVVGILFNFYIDIVIARKNAKRDLELVKYKKINEYFKRIHYLREYIAEIKLLEDNKFLLDEYSENIGEFNKIYKRYGTKIGTLKFINGIIQSILVSFLIYFMLVYDLIVKRSISIGDFSAILGSIWNLTEQLTTLIGNVSILTEDAVYCEKMKKFMELHIEKSAGKEKFPDSPKKIELRNISFSYNGKDKILNNISMTINSGDKIAIVGENGAGKSTLINIILGLYSNYEGTILLDNKDIKKYDNVLRNDYFGALSQNFNIYSASILDNVSMGEDKGKKEIIKALDEVGFKEKLNTLSNGIYTILTREFDDDGINLSGGQNHMIAMARVIINDYSVICLDEPSSDLDPRSESVFNDLLLSSFGNRTVIFISHRFFATRQIEKIYMMSNGRIIEQGNHDELMKLGGKYAEMYKIQEEKYAI